MHEVSFHTAHKIIPDHKKDTSAWAKLLTWEGGEHENDEINLIVKQSKTPTMGGDKSRLENVVPSYIEMESKAASQSGPSKETLVAKQITMLEMDSLDEILQCAY